MTDGDFMTTEKRIINAEHNYKSQIEKIAKEIAGDKNIRLVLIAGPSCSGKTTTSSTLSRMVYEMAGITSHTISIDDFYHDVVFLPGETFADKDFEALDSIDLDLLHKCLHDLALGKTVNIPLFDFELTRRNGFRSTITLKENEIAIIEGLHALNPEIYENFVEKSKMKSIFLDCNDIKDTHKHARLIRRLVRDRNFRNADAFLTFTLWEKVLRGEEKYIYPYADKADFKVNTFHEYEPEVLKPYAEVLLDEIKQDSIFIKEAQSARLYLSSVKDIVDKSLIPEDSLLREFVG